MLTSAISCLALSLVSKTLKERPLICVAKLIVFCRLLLCVTLLLKLVFDSYCLSLYGAALLKVNFPQLHSFNRSDTNEADEALSRRALSSTEDTSGAVTNTWQVMSRELDVNFMATFEVTGYTAGAGV